MYLPLPCWCSAAMAVFSVAGQRESRWHERALKARKRTKKGEDASHSLPSANLPSYGAGRNYYVPRTFRLHRPAEPRPPRRQPLSRPARDRPAPESNEQLDCFILLAGPSELLLRKLPQIVRRSFLILLKSPGNTIWLPGIVAFGSCGCYS